MSSIIKGLYQHFKGDEVEVVGLACHSETLEDFVVYRHLTGQHAGENHFWIRPIRMFLEEVEKDGIPMPRFKLIKKLPD